MNSSSTRNAVVWEGIRKNYSNKIKTLEDRECQLRTKVEALENLISREKESQLTNSIRSPCPPQPQVLFHTPSFSGNKSTKDECLCKPCQYMKRYQTTKCRCISEAASSAPSDCGCSQESGKKKEESDCDCDANLLEELLGKIEKSAPDILAKNVEVPPPKTLKTEEVDDCKCEAEDAMKSRILPIIDEMLEDFCCACNDVKKVYKTLHSKHNCSCLNMLEISPSSCVCEPQSSDVCTCKKCMCDPCGFKQRIGSKNRNNNKKHSPDCECHSCVCEPCSPGQYKDSGLQHGAACDCDQCVCDPCGQPVTEPSKAKTGGGEGSKTNNHRDPSCDCEQCECNPCGQGTKSSKELPKASKHEQGCECSKCVCNPCGVPPNLSSIIRKPASNADECLCDDLGKKKTFNRPAPQPPSGRSNSKTVYSKENHGSQCDCLECVCDNCKPSNGVRSNLSANIRKSAANADECLCDELGKKKTISRPAPQTSGGRSNSRTIASRENHGSQCDCLECVCDDCKPSKIPTFVGKPSRDISGCGCGHNSSELLSKAQFKRNSSHGNSYPARKRTNSKIPAPKGCTCRDPCPCGTCYFDEETFKALTENVLGAKDDCSCGSKGKHTLRTKLTKVRNDISNMSLKSVDIGHMKEIISMYDKQKELKRRIRDLENKQKHLSSNRCG